MRKFLALLSAVLFAGEFTIASSAHIPVRSGERAMIDFQNGQNDELVDVMYIYSETNYAKVCRKTQGRHDFNPNCQYITVPVESLIQPVMVMDSYKINDRVCLNKDVRFSISTFRKGECGRVVRMYANGKVEILTFSLFGLRQRFGEFDLLVDISDIVHKN